MKTTEVRTAGRRHLGVVLLGLTYLCVAVFWLLGAPAGRAFEVVTLEAAAKLLLWGGTCLLATMVILPSTLETALRALGLFGGRISVGALVSVAATAPMAIVALRAFRGADVDLIAGNAIIGPLAEELLFRGFLFGLLVSVAGWRVPAAIATSAVMFGVAHVRDADMVITALMRGPDVLGYSMVRGAEVLSIRSGTEVWFGFLAERVPLLLARAVPLACGGAALAWITWRWRSLWPAVILHGLMNLWWELGRPELMRTPNGFDGLAVAQILTIVLAVALTTLATRKKQRLG